MSPKGMIILLSHEYPPYVFGGVATYSKQVAEWFASNGWKVYVLAGKTSFANRISIERKSEALTIIRVYFPEIPPRWVYYSILTKEVLERILNKEGSPKVVISNSPLTWLNLNKIDKKNTLVTSVYHNSIYYLLVFFQLTPREDIGRISLEELVYYNEAPLINYLYKKDLMISDLCVFVAKHVYEEFEHLYGRLMKTSNCFKVSVYPGIEYDYLLKLRQEHKRAGKEKNIIAYIGRLYYTKGVVHAVRTIEHLVKEEREKDIELWVFGRGPLKPWLNHYIKTRRLTGNIKYFEFIERSLLLSILARYVDVLLHPSLYEGAPLAIMESQALGIPSVTFDLPWAREFVVNGFNGYRATYPRIESLAKCVMKSTELQRENITAFTHRYDLNKSFQTLEDAMHKLLK